MDTAVLRTLEYTKIRAMLADCTGSVMGRELAEALTPVAVLADVRMRLHETREAVEILAAASNIPLGGARDVRALLQRAAIGAMLTPEELTAVGSSLYAARRMKAFFADIDMEAAQLKALTQQITVLRNVEDVIERTVSEHGGVRDEASSELAHIRREIRTAQGRIKEKLDSILRSQEYQKYFQDALVTMRGDRYVIPIKQEYRHYFPGIVHDQSASGATVFIEPMVVVQLNNDIKQHMAAEKNEVERILRVVSGQIARYAEEIRQNGEILAQLDFAFAKAKLAQQMKAVEAVVNEQGIVRLKKARHPLIPDDMVVPIDVWLGDTFDTLLITGPNTGGKTVTLKTVGLLALMTQAGLYIPAEPDSEMAVFHNIFADIGDEQSIEQSLSTFSAHMTHIVRILEKVSADDLVLFDELGAGTDPDEGAALAMAILETVLAVGAKTIATTHYSELKTFAYSRDGVENASVEFDVQTLRPTYRLLIGIPGSSNAFAISQRLGLSVRVIEQARQYITKEHAAFEEIVGALEEQKRTYQQLQDEALQKEQEINLLRHHLTADQQKWQAQRDRILRKAQEEASLLLRQARRESEEVIRELKEQFSEKSAAARQKAIDSGRRRLRDQLSAIHTEDVRDVDLPVATAKDVAPGSSVYVTTLQQKGQVLSVQGSEVTVQLGIMKMNVPLTACRLVAEKPEPVKANKSSKRSVIPKVVGVERQIDIRGMMVEEAENVLEKYLDDAVLAGLQKVIVIHGKGTGALRKGVRAYLKQHHHVLDISIAELNEGGDGATVVQLK